MIKIALIPFYKSLEKNYIFKKELFRDNINEVYFELKNYFQKKGLSLNTQDINTLSESKKIIFLRFDFKNIFKLFLLGKLNSSIYIQFEPPVIIQIHEKKYLKKMANIFGSILSWDDDIVGSESNIFKFYPPMPYRRKTKEVKFENKKLLCNISGNKDSYYKDELYSKRKEAIKYFEDNCGKEFDLYGVGWDKNIYSSYKGEIDSKNEVLKKYKFSLCYENMCQIKGLLSEKIFDCFYAKTVPIFWGAENIDEYIPKECYIDKRDFDSYEKLYNYLKNMTEKEYEKRMNAIEKYLNSKEYKLFLPENFSEIIYKVLIKKNNKKYNKLKAFLSFIQIILISFCLKIYNKIRKWRKNDSN